MSEEIPQRRTFRAEDADDLLRFIRENPASDHDIALFRSLLTRVPRSADHVLDVGLGGERVFVASVLDTLVNASDSALLAIMGYRDHPAGGRVFAWAMEAAERLTRSGPKKILEVPLPVSVRHHAPVLEARGYRVAFTQYLMTRPTADGFAEPSSLEGCRWADATEADLLAYHSLACSAFAGIPGSHLADFDTFRAMFRQSPIVPRLLLRDDEPIGFVRVSLDDDGESGVVNTIARAPAFRGRRLGGSLLFEAARLLAQHGARRLRLEVIATNRSALGLYLRHGFAVAAEEPTYQLDLVGSCEG